MQCINRRDYPCDPDCENKQCYYHLHNRTCTVCGNAMREIDYINHNGICLDCTYEKALTDDETLLDFFEENTDLLKAFLGESQKADTVRQATQARLWLFVEKKYER